MTERILTAEHLAAYGRWLREEEKAPATAEKYLRDAVAFARWMDGGSVTKEAVAGWKEHRLARLRTHHHQRNTGRPQQPVPFSRLGGLPGQVPQNPAPHLPGRGPGADSPGL